MALVGPALGAQIKTEIIAAFGPPADAEQLTKFCNALGKAIVEYVQASATVTINNAVVVSGAGAGGQVTGTGVVS